jgi:hypothetical protein
VSWIEVVDATGRVVARRTALGVPCTLGSAPDNTLLIEGPDVAAYHARIDQEADGRLTVTVLGQSSGLHRPGAPERAMSLALTPSAPVAVGGSVIRLVDEVTGTVVEGAHAPESSASRWRAFVARRPVQWGAAALLALSGAAIGYLTLPGTGRWANAAAVAVALLLAEGVWVGLWAITGRIRHGRARFGQHFVAATAIAIVGWGVAELESWRQFLWPGATAFATMLLALTALVWALAILLHLRVMNRAHWHRHVRIATGVGLAVFFLVLAARDYRVPWSDEVEFSAVLKPVPAAFVPARDPARFAASLEALQGKLDSEDEDQPSADK